MNARSFKRENYTCWGGSNWQNISSYSSLREGRNTVLMAWVWWSRTLWTISQRPFYSRILSLRPCSFSVGLWAFLLRTQHAVSRLWVRLINSGRGREIILIRDTGIAGLEMTGLGISGFSSKVTHFPILDCIVNINHLWSMCFSIEEQTKCLMSWTNCKTCSIISVFGQSVKRFSLPLTDTSLLFSLP